MRNTVYEKNYDLEYIENHKQIIVLLIIGGGVQNRVPPCHRRLGSKSLSPYPVPTFKILPDPIKIPVLI
jgi:hypothetical protein